MSQEQVVRDIARNAELLKASQEQLAKLVATTSQQNLPPRTSAPQPQAAIGTRKPCQRLRHRTRERVRRSRRSCGPKNGRRVRLIRLVGYRRRAGP